MTGKSQVWKLIPKMKILIFEKNSRDIFSVRNRCYASEGREEGDGVFDVTVCQFGAPIVLSWPHFLGAEQKYRNAVEGLNPEKVTEKKILENV